MALRVAMLDFPFVGMFRNILGNPCVSSVPKCKVSDRHGRRLVSVGLFRRAVCFSRGGGLWNEARSIEYLGWSFKHFVLDFVKKSPEAGVPRKWCVYLRCAQIGNQEGVFTLFLKR